MNRQGLTLIEVLIVLAILVLFAGVVIPAIVASRERDRLHRCQNNLKQISLALNNYLVPYRSFPPAWRSTDYVAWSGQLIILFLDDGPRLKSNIGQPWSTDPSLAATAFQFLHCPSDTGSPTVGAPTLNVAAGRSNYPTVSGATPITGRTVIATETGGPFGEDSRWDVENDFSDGLSHTFLVGERCAPNGNQKNPGGDTIWVGIRDNHTQQGQSLVIGDCSTGNLPNFRGTSPNSITGFSSLHWSGAHFLLADGTVRFISDKIDPATYANLAKIADGSSVDTNW